MHPTDAIRELEKVGEALVNALKHHKAQNEANAALHLSDRVLYSPLTTQLENALDSWKKIRVHLEDGL